MAIEINKLKADLLARATLTELTDEEKRVREKLSGAMKDVPVKRMIDQIIYLREQLLPAIKKKSTDKSADYEFFSGIVDTLLWAVIIQDRVEAMERRYVMLKIVHQLNLENVAYYEAELQKFLTLEELFLTDGLNRYAEAVKTKIDGQLKRVKGG
jgi:hypothetical protein